MEVIDVFGKNNLACGSLSTDLHILRASNLINQNNVASGRILLGICRGIYTRSDAMRPLLTIDLMGRTCKTLIDLMLRVMKIRQSVLKDDLTMLIKALFVMTTGSYPIHV
jgi:hypothetical protein